MHRKISIDDLRFDLIELDECRNDLQKSVDSLILGTGNLSETIETLTSSTTLLELLAIRIREQAMRFK